TEVRRLAVGEVQAPAAHALADRRRRMNDDAERTASAARRDEKLIPRRISVSRATWQIPFAGEGAHCAGGRRMPQRIACGRSAIGVFAVAEDGDNDAVEQVALPDDSLRVGDVPG